MTPLEEIRLEALDRALRACDPAARPGLVVAYARHFEHYLRTGLAGFTPDLPTRAKGASIFKDDGRSHFVATFPGGAVTPSGKNACVSCLEAWPCSTELYRRSGREGSA